jgi:EamA domain-containing membrane protein RarD
LFAGKQRSRTYVFWLVIFILGFLSPIAIPLILKADMSDGLKALVPGILAFRGQEVLMIVAGIGMGKENLTHVKTGVFCF